MADKNIFKRFSPNEIETLALLYVKNLDLAGKTPADLVVSYAEAYSEIKAAADELNPDKDVKQFSDF